MLKCSEKTLFDEYETVRTDYSSGIKNYDKGGKLTKLLWTKIMELCPGKYVNHVVEQEEKYKSTRRVNIAPVWDSPLDISEKLYDVKAYVTVYYDDGKINEI